MLRFGLVLMLACVAFAQRPAPLHDTCHCNNLGITEQTVINQLVHIVDVDNNNEVTVGEIVVGISRVIGADLPVSEETILGMNQDALVAMAELFGVSVTRTDFVQGWVSTFHDCPGFVGAVFDAFDLNKSGDLTARELEGIYDLARNIAGNFDYHLTQQELTDFFLWIYQVC